MTIIQVDNNFDPRVLAGASVAFGVFDGFHLGHRYLIAQTIASSAAEDTESVVLTFDRDPDEVFNPNALMKLMSNDERLAALDQSGVDHVVVLPFTPQLYTLEPVAFLEHAFAGHVPSHLHVGSDFRFGSRAAGDVNTLRAWGDTAGMKVHAHDLVSADGEAITATRIRNLLQAGETEKAIALLGHPLTANTSEAD